MKCFYGKDVHGEFIGDILEVDESNIFDKYDFIKVRIKYTTDDDKWIYAGFTDHITINLTKLIYYKIYENYEEIMEDYFEAFV